MSKLDDLIEVPDDIEQQFLSDDQPLQSKEDPATDIEDNPDSADSGEAQVGAEPEPAEEKPGDDGDNSEAGTNEREQRKRPKKDPQKRIDKLTYEKKTFEERAQKYESQVTELEAQLRETQERLNSYKAKDVEHEEQRLIQQRQEAEAVGDLQAYSKASDALFKFRADNMLAQENAAPEPRPAPQQAPQEEVRLHDSAQKWLEKNAWYTNPENSDLASQIQQKEEELLAQGYGYGDMLYQKIDEYIRGDNQFSQVIDRGAPAPQPNMPASSIDQGMPEGQRSPSTNKLTQADISQIKKFGLNPNDPDVRKRFIREKYGR